MAMVAIKRADGLFYNMWGWTPDIHGALQYRTKKDAEDDIAKWRLTGCSVEAVPQKIDPGHAKLSQPIFSGGPRG